MVHLLLVIIYIAFISLGLPDAILGSAWPVMYGELGVAVSFAGVVSMIIAGGTIVSSLMSDTLTRRLGAGLLTAISVALTAVALLGFSVSTSAWQLCLWGIPYGLGAGSVDAALNNFVAVHYKSRHMSWLHCFWGVGATLGPYIMGVCLTGGFGWNAGYRAIGLVQVLLSACLLLSLPLWRKKQEARADSDGGQNRVGLRQALALRGVKEVLIAFFCYCALEATTGLWASSYLVLHRGVDAQTAARWASLFYLGITAGRFLCGFVADRLGDERMVRLGQCVMVLGVLLLLLPLPGGAALLGLGLVGFGCAPVYPSFIHATPARFGPANSQAIIGMQMASAYVGTTLMPPLFGLIAQYISVALYPAYLLLLAVLMAVMAERLNRKTR